MQEASGCLRGYRLCGPSLVCWSSYCPHSQYKGVYKYWVYCIFSHGDGKNVLGTGIRLPQKLLNIHPGQEWLDQQSKISEWLSTVFVAFHR